MGGKFKKYGDRRPKKTDKDREILYAFQKVSYIYNLTFDNIVI